MDDNNLTKRRKEILEKLKQQFKLNNEEATKVVKSLESYCELIIHTMKNK